MVSIFSQTLQ